MENFLLALSEKVIKVMNETMILELIRQMTDRISRLESQQFYLLATSVFTLIGIIVNLYLTAIKRKLKRGENND